MLPNSPESAVSEEKQNPCRVGVSVVVHNRLKELGPTLESLTRAVNDADRVCVVDNASDDRSMILKYRERFPRFHWRLSPENLGFGAGHHFALEWLMTQGCRYLLMLNPDLRMPADMLNRFVEVSRSCRDLWVLGPLLVRDGSDDPEIDSAGLELDGYYRAGDRFQGLRLSQTPLAKSDPDFPHRVPALCGAALWVPAQLLPLRPDAPVFSPEYFAYFEDMELGLELALNQTPMGLVPGIRLLHQRGGFGRLRAIKSSDRHLHPQALRGVLLNRYRTMFRQEGISALWKRPQLLFYEPARWTYLLLRYPYLASLLGEVSRIWKEEKYRKRHPPLRIAE